MNRRVKLAHLIKWHLCLLIVLNYHLDCCIADQCFEYFKTPKIINTDPFTYCDIEAITKDWYAMTIFVGGSINKRTADEMNNFLYWKLKRAPRKNITIGQQYFLIQISLPSSFQITHIEFLLTLPSKVNRDSDNLFLLLGPNTLGNTSAIIVVWYPDSEWHFR